MSGTFTLGGMADGLLIGQVTVGPASMNGRESISEVFNVALEANVDFPVKVPSGATAFACVFTFGGEAPSTVLFRTNLNAGDAGCPLGALGWVGWPLASGTTELKFKSAAPPAVFQLTFI